MKDKRLQRRKRIRAKIKGTNERPRLSVFRSNKYIYAQIIDDEKGKTLVGVSEKQIKEDASSKKTESSKKIDKSKTLGLMLAKLAVSKKIKSVVFDRSGYAYHGRVKAIAEGAREGGLKF
ncbi:MAG: 50S ribosomal protein L18 [Patescibacteria group bacterium]